MPATQQFHAANPERDLRERIHFHLALIGLLIWLVATFWIVVALDLVHMSRQLPIMLAGLIGLAIAALPWLAYPWLLARARRRLAADPPQTAHQPRG